jgi:hypothetical protein
VIVIMRNWIFLFVSTCFSAVACGEGAVPMGTDAGAVSNDAPYDASKVERASVPQFSVPGGEYKAAQVVAITSETPNASIYYTVDGNPPNRASIPYTTTIAITSSSTLKAIAIKDGYEDSQVNSATYSIVNDDNVASAPTISPPGGTFTAAQTVTLATTEPSGRIYFTTNGLLPTTKNGVLYTEPFSVAASGTVLAVTTATGKLDSAPAVAAFVINIAMTEVSPPVLSSPAGEYVNDVSLTMSSPDGETICYTLDGTPPSCDAAQATSSRCTGNSLRYTADTQPAIAQPRTVKALACKPGLSNSTVTSATYTFRADAPALSAPAGEITYDTKATTYIATVGAVLLYTAATDGTTPADPGESTAGTCSPAAGTTSVPFTSLPWSLTRYFDNTATSQGLRRGVYFKFRSCRVGYTMSAVVNASYSVKLTAPTVISTPGSDSYPFGYVSDTMTPRFEQLQTLNAGVGAGFGALGAGAICITADGSMPACTAQKTGCTTVGTYTSGDAFPVVTNNAQQRAYKVLGCKPGAIDSPILSGSWTFRLRIGGAAAPSAQNLAPHQASLPSGTYTFRLKALRTDSPATPGSSQVALGTGDSPSEVFFHYTTDGTDPVRPATCSDLPTGSTLRVGSGSAQDGEADIVLSHTGTTTVKVLACTGNAAHYLDSPITTLSWSSTGAAAAPSVSPAVGTYKAPLSAASAPFKISKAPTNGGDSICFGQGGTIPACGAGTSPCAAGSAVVWSATSNDIVFDGATMYTLDGNANRTLPIIDDNTKGNVHVVACKAGTPGSAVLQARYTFQVPDPALPPTIKKGLQATPSTVLAGASWRFVAGAGVPTCSSQDWAAYTIPNDQALPLTVNAVACKTTWDPSNVVTQTYASFAP